MRSGDAKSPKALLLEGFQTLRGVGPRPIYFRRARGELTLREVCSASGPFLLFLRQREKTVRHVLSPQPFSQSGAGHGSLLFWEGTGLNSSPRPPGFRRPATVLCQVGRGQIPRRSVFSTDSCSLRVEASRSGSQENVAGFASLSCCLLVLWPGARMQIRHATVETRHLRIIRFRNINACCLVDRDRQIEHIHRIEVDLLAQIHRRIDSLSRLRGLSCPAPARPSL